MQLYLVAAQRIFTDAVIAFDAAHDPIDHAVYPGHSLKRIETESDGQAAALGDNGFAAEGLEGRQLEARPAVEAVEILVIEVDGDTVPARFAHDGAPTADRIGELVSEVRVAFQCLGFPAFGKLAFGQVVGQRVHAVGHREIVVVRFTTESEKIVKLHGDLVVRIGFR